MIEIKMRVMSIVIGTEIILMVKMVTIPGVTTGNDGAQLVERRVVKSAGGDQIADKLKRFS